MRIITGQRFSSVLVFDSYKRPQVTCLTRWLLRGASLAEQIQPYVKEKDKVLDFGGGIGRLGAHLVEHCQSLTSVDVEPLTVEYGPAICPEIDFRLLDEVDENEQFDFIFSVAVFFHFDFEQQQKALQWIHQHLSPTGTCLIDIMLDDKSEENEQIYTTNKTDFREYCRQYFEMKEISLFNIGVLLKHRAFGSVG